MAAFEFVEQSNRDGDNIAATPESLINLYAEPLPKGSTAAYSLKSVLGTEEWAALPGVFVRAAAVVSGVPYAVIGGRLYSIASSGAATDLGEIADSATTTISGNNGNVCIAANGAYRVWDVTTLNTPTEGTITSIGAVEFLGGYTIITELDGRRFQWSALADPEDLPGLNFATAEAQDDTLLRPIAIAGNLWLFGTESIEIWQITGQASENAFARIPGAVIETGLKSHNLITRFPDGAFFVGDDNIAYLAGGSQITPIPGIAVQTALATGSATDCFYYEDEGHPFCVIRFSDRPAWVFDIATGLWHQRATGTDAWVATTAIRAYEQWRVGAADGTIRTLARNNRDVSRPLTRQATSKPLYVEGRRFKVPMIEVRGRVGFSDIGRDAIVLLSVSRDGGLTWATPREASMGNLGEYERRMVFRQLGQSRQFAIRLTITDPSDLTLYSSVNAEVV